MKTTHDSEESILGSIQDDQDPQRQDATDALVLRTMEGDRRALGAIARHFGPMLRREARQALRERGGAEDVVQEFYLRVLEQQTRYTRADGHAEEWMRRTIWQMALRRRSGRRR